MINRRTFFAIGRILCLAILIVFLFAQPDTNRLPTVQKVSATSRSITLVGSYSAGSYGGGSYRWNASSGNPNPTITVTQGDSVTLSLSSAGGATHQFYVDINKNQVADCPSPDKCSPIFSTSTPISYPFTIDFAGTYTYYCTYHPGTMYGTFIAQAPPSPDFSLSVTPASLTIAVGSSGNFTLHLQSVNSFSGTVNLSPSVAPAGTYTSASANPTSVSLSAGGTATSIITLRTSGSSGLYSTPTPDGTYTLTVTGTSGALMHSSTSTANVGATPTPTGNTSPALPDQAALLAGVGVVVLVAAIATIVLIARKRSRK